MLQQRRLWIAGIVSILALAAIISRDYRHLILAQERSTATPNVNWIVTQSDSLVWSGPGYGFTEIGILSFGNWVQPLGRDITGNWILISYLFTQGWIPRDEAQWRQNTNALPVIMPDAITPIPRPLYYNTPGGPTQTPNVSWVKAGQEGAYVRSGPGQGYLPIGELFTGDAVDPVAHDRAEDWVLIRYGDGYGWLRYDLAIWAVDIRALPVIDFPDLTPDFTRVPYEVLFPPTATRTPRATFTATPTITQTPSATATITPSATMAPSATQTPSATATASSTSSPTPSPTLSPTPIPTASPTPPPMPTATFTSTATAVPSATVTPSPVPSATPTATATTQPTTVAQLPAVHTPTTAPTASPTSEPSLTPSPRPTETASATATATASATATATASATVTASATASVTASATSTQSPTSTVTPSGTPSKTLAPTLTATHTATPTILPANSGAGGESAADRSSGGDGPTAATWILGGFALAVIGYLLLYALQMAVLARAKSTFVLTTCPVCETGHLSPDVRRYRVLGIPRARRTIRCDTCRSVLRQVSRNHWRYAIDGAVNAELYARYNGRIMAEEELRGISPDYRGIAYESFEDDNPPA